MLPSATRGCPTPRMEAEFQGSCTHVQQNGLKEAWSNASKHLGQPTWVEGPLMSGPCPLL